MINTKRELRKEVLNRMNALGEDELKKSRILITERILGHQWYYGAKDILIFASYNNEIDTSLIIEDAVLHGKNVYLPRVEDSEIRFYKIESLDELQLGYKGIREPKGGTPMYPDGENADNALLIMPGVCFDMFNNRIGYGKGFYDRFLSRNPALILKSIAIGHKCQLVEKIEAEDNDIKPYQVILV
ncbi:MAG: 5-formyltetrahydrofolate cyclo-ligase [Lachnospiraceae bacterium]|nr:5-formyltetrahydrofolate cyclo-ligase [Lachnospiraceae bacterium]